MIVVTMMTWFKPSARTGLALVVLAAFGAVVGAGTLFSCPFMQALSCCSKTAPANHCPSEQPENCLLDVSENKVVTAKPKLTLTVPQPAVIATLPVLTPDAAAEPALLPARDCSDLYLLNRVLLI
jgi:hypothetical protein